jgi:hypothetical protein
MKFFSLMATTFAVVSGQEVKNGKCHALAFSSGDQDAAY